MNNKCPRCNSPCQKTKEPFTDYKYCSRSQNCFMFNDRLQAFSIFDNDIEYRVIIFILDNLSDIRIKSKGSPIQYVDVDYVIPNNINLEDLKIIVAFS